MAHCPECDAIIDMADDEVEEGDKLDCNECGAELEVVGTNPLELRAAAEEDEDEEEEW
ncbi:MAG TPA: lysine biosynthesis protein LysW [Terriglobia bacterium]|nr:lysine biosynthesis protein LysW [Terriglobia bacterium]